MRWRDARHLGHDRLVVMPETSAAELCQFLDEDGLRYWVVGGWGVDALLERCTRAHKDLDVLFVLSQHDRAWRLLHEQGYRLAYLWEENVDVPGNLVDDRVQPTAYMLEHPSGGLVDVHVLDDRTDELRAGWTTDRVFCPGALDARGSIDGYDVPCMSAAMQLITHEGYELPEAHQRDVIELRRLIDP